MQKAKVNQERIWPANRPEQTGNRNWFEGLSHRWVATFTMGKLTPFLKIPVFPNDYFKINAEVMMRFAPLYLPIMHRVNLSLDYFFVPNRIIWADLVDGDLDSWEAFVMNRQELEVPFVVYNASDLAFGDQAGEVASYMGAPQILGAVANPPAVVGINLNALPLAAYYMIYDQFYRNDQITQPVNPQMEVHSGTGGAVVFTDTDAADLNCKFRLWNRDLFTVCTPEPAAGMVQIPLISDDADNLYPTRWRKLSDGTDPPTGGLVYNDSPDFKTSIGSDYVGLDIQASAASIEQFRFASIYQEYLERVNRTGDKYSDHLQNFWDTDPYKGTLQLPQFLGAKNGRVVVSEVMSTAETATLKVGNYAGQALALESTNQTIEYHCLEHGYIIGIVSVYPDSSYFQGLERDWTKSTYLDFADPRFALVGDEEVLNRELLYSFDSVVQATGYNTEVFGYRERFLDSRFKNDTVAGLMRTVLNSFHLGRILNITNPNDPDDGAVLNTAFLECRPRVSEVFQVAQGEDEIYCHIYNDIKVQRMLPKFGIPRL